MQESVTVVAPAKINLRLRILSQQTNGYHSLESVFCAVSLHDEITIARGTGEVELEVAGGVDVGPDDDNLVVRAARRFFLEIGATGDGARIHLRKGIPAAAGLGGGSSDAAATLAGLNVMLGHPLSDADLLRMSGELGSDVPFFLCGSPLALGWGRGERLLALPALPPRPLLIAHPGIPIPTGQAFQRVAELRGGGFSPPASAFSIDDLRRWERVARIAGNDFEPAAAERVPTFAAGKEAMLAAGAEVALLSGSGSAIFGVFETALGMDDAERALGELGFRTWRAETLDRMPSPRLPLAQRG